MKKMYWVFVSVLFLVGLGSVLYFGLKPRPVPKIKLSFLVSPEEMGHAMTQRLHLEIQNQDILFIGVDPNVPSHVGVVKGFVESIRGTPLEYKNLVLEKNLPQAEDIKQIFRKNVEIAKEGETKSRGVEMMDLKEELQRLIEGLRQKNPADRILVIGPAIYFSHILPGNSMDRLKQMSGSHWTSFTMADFPVRREEEPMQVPACAVADDDHEGSGPLGCLIQNQARLGYRKEKKPGKYTGQMDQIGQFEYLVLFTKSVY